MEQRDRRTPHNILDGCGLGFRTWVAPVVVHSKWKSAAIYSSVWCDLHPMHDQTGNDGPGFSEQNRVAKQTNKNLWSRCLVARF